MFANFLAPLTGILIGLVMGLTGAGGGILAVPALVYTQGWSMQQAMPVALLGVTAGAALGALEGFMRKLVRYRAGMLMALAGSLPTWLGVQLAARLSQAVLMNCFALILCVAATRLLLQLRHPHQDSGPHCMVRIDADTGRFRWNPLTAVVIAAIGAVSGLMTGLLGVGGGFIIVPMLRHFTNVTMHGAVATSLFVISLVGSMGVLSATARGVPLPGGFALVFVLTIAGGMLIARKLAAHLPARAVQGLFAMLLLGVAASLFYKAALAG